MFRWIRDLLGQIKLRKLMIISKELNRKGKGK
jgi:hypothetical protein